MRMIEAIAARLDHFIRMAGNRGTDLSSANLSSESQIRNAIWRCIFCQYGSECGEWVLTRRRSVPVFCRNREFYLERARNIG